MASVRCKFSVWSVSQLLDKNREPMQETVKLQAVYGKEGENAKFWEATPSGQIEILINNKAAFGEFTQGKQFYVDFTLAD